MINPSPNSNLGATTRSAFTARKAVVPISIRSSITARNAVVLPWGAHCKEDRSSGFEGTRVCAVSMKHRERKRSQTIITLSSPKLTCHPVVTWTKNKVTLQWLETFKHEMFLLAFQLFSFIDMSLSHVLKKQSCQSLERVLCYYCVDFCCITKLAQIRAIDILLCRIKFIDSTMN